MATKIANIQFERVSVVDDDPLTRESFSEYVVDLNVEAVPEQTTLPNANDYAVDLKNRAQGVLCDYHLKKKAYATFDGDELVESLYKQHVPVVLCTRFTDLDMAELRVRRKFIPSLLMPTDLNPDSLAQGFEICIEEYLGKFRSCRKAIRTLVRIDETIADDSVAGGQYFHVVVPAWSTQGRVRLYPNAFPPDVGKQLRDGLRLYAFVNVASECADELYFSQWELAE